ncbi:hypothetical protein GCM10010420_42320 [Streptomyces glaucosporus]|uniref:Uncharacterized protein n=1 Tax=Streptomyces glaucosporus TaxID=284044 RepID=A0ABP5VSZ9_9ACTN
MPGRVRQWIEAVIDTLKGRLSLEQHGGRTPAGVFARTGQRLLALAAGMSRYMISSFETHNSCAGQMAALNDDPNPVYYYGYATECVGDRANDNIGYIKVWDAL